MQARPIKNMTGAYDKASGRFAVQLTDAANQSLAVAMGANEAAKLIAYILSLAAQAPAKPWEPGTGHIVEGLHPRDFGYSAGTSKSESLFYFQIGPIRFALSLPMSKWVEMCRSVVVQNPKGSDGKSKAH